MREPFENKLAAKLEGALGPILSAWDRLLATRISLRVLSIWIFIITVVWWPCRLHPPRFLRFGFWETVCLDIITIGPVANILLLLALLGSAARIGWPDRAWILPAIICALSPLPVVFAGGLLGGTGL